MHQGRFVLGAWGPNRTWWWNVDNDHKKRFNRRVGYAADVSGNRLASCSEDQYNGGCTFVTNLTGRRIWRSCDERVSAFSPQGRRMATVHILSDGLGPTQVWARRGDGQLEASYTARWFGDIYWENEPHSCSRPTGSARSRRRAVPRPRANGPRGCAGSRRRGSTGSRPGPNGWARTTGRLALTRAAHPGAARNITVENVVDSRKPMQS